MERTCAECGTVVREIDDKAIIGEVPYHSRCWDREQRRRQPRLAAPPPRWRLVRRPTT